MRYKITERLKQLIRQAIKDCNENAAAFARDIKINPVDLHRYINGTTKSVYLETWNKFRNYFPEIDDRKTINIDNDKKNPFCAVTGRNVCIIPPNDNLRIAVFKKIMELDDSGLAELIMYVEKLKVKKNILINNNNSTEAQDVG